MNEHYLQSRGIYYRMNVWEKGRKTLVFVHGLVGSSTAWKPFEEYFEGSYNILEYDLRGHGKSRKPLAYDAYAITEHVEDLETLTRELGAEKFTLISHSFGTLIALEYIAVHQDTLEHIVFLSPSFSLNKISKTRVVKPIYKIAVLLMRLIPFSGKVRGQTDYTKYVQSRDWNVARTIADMRNTGLHVYFYSMLHVYDVNREELLSHITVPVLLIHGKRDGMFPVDNSHIMAKKIRNARLVILPEADHIIVLNNAPEICGEIERLMRE